MSTSPKRLVALTSAAVAFAGMAVLAPPAQANPGGTGLVITEVYGGGGSSSASAAYQVDFVELYNPTAGSLSVDGMSLQYRSQGYDGTGTVSVAALPDETIAAGEIWLAQVSGPNATPGGAELPTPDFASTNLNMSASDGQIILSSGTTEITQLGDLAGAVGVVDMVGYGNGATSFETANSGTDTNNTVSISRTPEPGTDTDDNSADFAAPATPSPGELPPTPPTDPTAATIAEIQGDNVTTSPMLDDLVVTEGVVTAAYPTGGFFGFYMQTEGTGAADVDPATRTHSDGIFVRQTVAAGDVTVVPGDFVSVTGIVKEFAGQTQVEVSDAADIEVLVDVPDPVVATTTTTWPDTAGEKEALEGMLFTPEGNFTITNNFGTNTFGELGLAVGDQPLIQPTEVGEAGSAEAAAAEADNAARAIVLDDGASQNYTDAANQDETPPYLSNATPWRTGATGTFSDDVILGQGGSPSNPTYRFQPLERVTGPANTASPYAVPDTRTGAPDDARLTAEGTPEVKVASFNVLNYFTTLGDADNDNVGDGGCQAFNDRDGDGNNVRTGCDQRGAWDPQDLARQQEKIVAAINALDADVIGLMEIENSAQLGETPNEALDTLVAALNADAGAGTWAANPVSPQLPSVASDEMDVIANAIIYRPDAVVRVGPSLALGHLSSGDDSETDEPFANAREPLGQKFAPAGGGEEFLVVVNHFKSKGSAGPFPGDTDQGDGQGAGNESRIRQAEALADWIPTVQGTTDDVLLIGDFNAYTMEDPMQVLYDAGYQDFEVLAGHTKYSYSFSGLSGSLDHVLGNAGAVARMTGADIWNANAVESVAMEYSRWNNHATDFHEPGPFRSSDHDPVVVGLAEGDLDIQILGTNDFHGRILNDPFNPTAGAAVLAGAVKQLRTANPNTVFAAAGDLIGASTFESFIQKDKPTIDALNEAGLEVSSVGNHEFDQGYDDLVNRVMAPYDPTTNPLGGAEWEYIGANLEMKATGDPTDIAPSWIEERSGVQVGFVGAVTEELPSLVSPAGIADIQVTDIVAAVNEEANALKTAGADIIVMLVHEGSSSTDCATMDDDPSSPFGSIIHGVNDNIDAIVSGHTHLEYNCSFPVAGWAGRAVTERPVVSAGQYGMALNQIVFTVDPTTHEVLAKSQAVLRLKASNAGPANYPADPATEAIVAQAVIDAGPLGELPLGEIAGPFSRARFDGGAENRGGESTLGNLVAEVQRWATENPESGSAQIAFMNPGGLRDDMLGVGDPGDPYPRTVTYRQAAAVQSFANTLVNMDLTGAQIKSVLEEQWQPAAASRPFLRLGVSDGFEYTYDPSMPAGSRILNMWLDGTPIDPATTYSVTVNSFLAAGGDNFFTFGAGTGKQDTGKIDLQAMVDYLDEFANTSEGDSPLPISYAQRAVGVKFPAGAPASYEAGTDHVEFDLTSLSMTETDAVRDSEVTVKLGGATLGTFPVTTTLSPPGNANSNDEAGTASVDVVLPGSTPAGPATLVVEGAATGTSFEVPITVTQKALAPTEVAGAVTRFPYGEAGLLKVAISRDTADGEVEVYNDKDVLIGTVTMTAGRGTMELAPKLFKPGTHELRLEYLGTDHFAPATGFVTFIVEKPRPKVRLFVADKINKFVGGKARIRVTALNDVPVRGRVTLTVMGTGKSVTGKLVDGKVVLKLPKLTSVGKYRLKAKYLGSPLLATAKDIVAIRVVK